MSDILTIARELRLKHIHSSTGDTTISIHTLFLLAQAVIDLSERIAELERETARLFGGREMLDRLDRERAALAKGTK